MEGTFGLGWLGATLSLITPTAPHLLTSSPRFLRYNKRYNQNLLRPRDVIGVLLFV
jgi:hypothetical protein